MNAVILERPDQFKSGAVADMGKARVAVPAKVTLRNEAVLGAVEQRAPFLQFLNAIRSLLREDFDHAPVVEVLTAPDGVPKMHLPAVAVIGVA